MPDTPDATLTLRNELIDWQNSYRALRSAVSTLPIDQQQAVWCRIPEFMNVERARNPRTEVPFHV